jgi:hypothetical protein
MIRPYVEEIKKSRLLSRMAETLGTRGWLVKLLGRRSGRWLVKLLGRRLLNLYTRVYTGEATYSLLLKPVKN